MPLLVEGEGFEIHEPKAVDGARKSATIPAEQVQRIRRKTHSPCPSDGPSADSPQVASVQACAKRRHFGGISVLYGHEAGTRWRRERNWDRTFST
jgi:hypothetical protein